MKLSGSVGLEGGFRFRYGNLIGEGKVTGESLQLLRPAMDKAVRAVRAIRKEGFSKAHLSKDGTPEHVYFPRQAYLEEGNPNDMASVRSLEELGAQWKDTVDAAVFIGIGGSYLGDKVIFDLATKPYWNQLPKKERNGYPQIYFAGNNVDGTALQGLMRHLSLQAQHVGHPLQVQLVPVSKSGTTMEPLTSFAALFTYMKAHPEWFAVDVTTVTGLDEKESLLYRLALKNNWPAFSIPEGIGGRFCILSNPGLLMCAVLGYDIRALLEGAREMSELCLTTEGEENPALLNASLKYLAAKDLGADIEVLMGYGDTLQCLGAWYVQLLAESLGKRLDRNGKTAFYGRGSWYNRYALHDTAASGR